MWNFCGSSVRMWEPEMPVGMGMQGCLTFSVSLPTYPEEKGLPVCPGVCRRVWDAAGPLPGFPGQKGKMWVIPLAADRFI